MNNRITVAGGKRTRKDQEQVVGYFNENGHITEHVAWVVFVMTMFKSSPVCQVGREASGGTN